MFVIHEQALVQLVEDMLVDHGRGLVRIERRRVRRLAPSPDPVGLRLAWREENRRRQRSGPCSAFLLPLRGRRWPRKARSDEGMPTSAASPLILHGCAATPSPASGRRKGRVRYSATRWALDRHVPPHLGDAGRIDRGGRRYRGRRRRAPPPAPKGRSPSNGRRSVAIRCRSCGRRSGPARRNRSASSMARARQSTSQWSLPVCMVKADGRAISCAPFSTSAWNR